MAVNELTPSCLWWGTGGDRDPRRRGVAGGRRGRVGRGVVGGITITTTDNNSNNNILYSSQREIKAVVRSHTLPTTKNWIALNYLNNLKLWNTHTYPLLDPWTSCLSIYIRQSTDLVLLYTRQSTDLVLLYIRQSTDLVLLYIRQSTDLVLL